MTSEHLFVAEPQFLHDQLVTEIEDVVDSSDITTSYCVCDLQPGSSLGLKAQCILTSGTQHCSGSSQSTEDSVGAIYTSCLSSYRKKRSVSSSRTTERSSTSDSDDVFDFRPLTYHDDVNNTNEVVRDNLFYHLLVQWAIGVTSSFSRIF